MLKKLIPPPRALAAGLTLSNGAGAAAFGGMTNGWRVQNIGGGIPPRLARVMTREQR